MKTITNISDYPFPNTPSAITIGNFDGVHLGHQEVIKMLVESAKKENKLSVVITYSNHPIEVLRPDIDFCKICTLEHKLKLIEALGVDVLIILPFTKEFSNQSAKEFIETLTKHTCLSHLILGWDTSFGKNKEGNKEIVKQIAADSNIKVDYLNQLKIDNVPISSSEVKKLIKQKDFESFKKITGRPYSILSFVDKGEGRGKKLGFPTANISITGLCTLPIGVYAVDVIHKEKHYNGIANLGVAPTLKNEPKPVLEVNIFDFNQDIYAQNIEVIFKQYIRSEKKFSNVEELKQQIAHDIQVAKNIQIDSNY